MDFLFCYIFGGGTDQLLGDSFRAKWAYNLIFFPPETENINSIICFFLFSLQGISSKKVSSEKIQFQVCVMSSQSLNCFQQDRLLIYTLTHPEVSKRLSINFEWNNVGSLHKHRNNLILSPSVLLQSDLNFVVILALKPLGPNMFGYKMIRH